MAIIFEETIDISEENDIIIKKAIYCIRRETILNASDVLQIMDHKYALFGLFFAFHSRLQTVGDSFYEEITCKQFFLLACMNLFQDEAPTANELAKTMGCTRQNVKEILNSLEKKQFIRLEVDQEDKRKRRVYLTENALHMTDKYQEKETIFMKYLFEGISDEEIDSAYNIIMKIEDNLKRMNREI